MRKYTNYVQKNFFDILRAYVMLEVIFLVGHAIYMSSDKISRTKFRLMICDTAISDSSCIFRLTDMFHAHGTNLCACMYDAMRRVNTLEGANKRERKREREKEEKRLHSLSRGVIDYIMDSRDCDTSNWQIQGHAYRKSPCRSTWTTRSFDIKPNPRRERTLRLIRDDFIKLALPALSNRGRIEGWNRVRMYELAWNYVRPLCETIENIVAIACNNDWVRTKFDYEEFNYEEHCDVNYSFIDKYIYFDKIYIIL